MGAALISLLVLPQSASAADLLSARDFLAVCARDQAFCQGYAQATTDWYRSEIGKPGIEFLPYCLRPGDDDAKILIGAVQWFFEMRRFESPVEPWAGETWEALLDRPVQDAAVSLLPAAYPCPDVVYPDYFPVWLGFESG